MAEYSFRTLTCALHGKETYVVRLPYPHVFAELYKAILPFCKPTAAATAEREESDPETLKRLAPSNFQPSQLLRAKAAK
jgi:hypothetical protein